MPTTISLTYQDDIGYLTFVPETSGKPPTLDRQVLDDLGAILRHLGTAVDRLRAVVVRSAAERYFIVGANLRAMECLDATTITPWVLEGHAVVNELAALPLPVIAFIEGYALGGGLELALACDLMLSTPAAQFGQPEAALGLVPGWGGSYRLPRRVGVARAKELYFTGKRINAETAYAWGLVDFVAPKEELEVYLAELLTGIRGCSAVAVAQVKGLLNGSLEITLAECGHQEAEASRHCFADPDTQRRVAAFLAGRKGKSAPK